MKNKAFNLIRFVFVIIFIIFFIFVSSNCFFATETNKYPKRNQFFQNITAEEKNTIDVLFVGDSTVLNAVSPIVLWQNNKITSYNISYSIMQPKEAYFDTLKVFETQSPKYVFLEASFLVDVVNKDVFLQWKANDRIMLLNNQITGYIEKIFPTIRYKNSLKDMSFKEIIRKKPKSINSIYKGYNYSKHSIPFVEGTEFNETGEINFVNNGDNYFYLLKDYCDKNNCELILFSLPHISSWREDKHNKIAELADKENIKYIDYHLNSNKLIDEFSWKTDTQDGGAHLNFSGATKTTKAIGDYLVNELGMEPTKLTKEQAEKWDNDTKLFYEAIKKE